VEPVDEPARTEAFAHLQELIAIGRRYQLFAQENPSQAAVQIAELNMPGLQGNAWDLLWLPEVIRAKIARVSSVVVLELCGRPFDQEHDPRLMDVLMPVAIAAGCLVADAYGVGAEIPPRPLPGRLDVLAQLVYRVTVGQTQGLETRAGAHADLLSSAKPPIVACLPSRVRDRLIGLAHIMAGGSDSVHVKILTVILIIGAVAAETFEPLNFSGLAPGSSLPTT
jgi:hypothetical protein